ncbi:hypothetical protein V496_10403 [Pseudogymnoascus sp. VKM F-4515 (FW-2607)]|nr:hypothetical protein V496_10403 [Pseudogymnoascus sp. VKM F-4515 (FW-2607)]
MAPSALSLLPLPLVPLLQYRRDIPRRIRRWDHLRHRQKAQLLPLPLLVRALGLAVSRRRTPSRPNVPYPPLATDATAPLLAASEDLLFAGCAADEAVLRELAVPEDAEAEEEDEEAAKEEEGEDGGEEAEPGGLDEEDGEGGFGFEVGAVGGLEFGHSGGGRVVGVF